MTMQGKTAVITGAGRGIGRAIAQRFAKEGALVAVNYQKNAEAAAATVNEIEAAGGSAFAIQGDVGSTGGIQSFFAALDAELTKRQDGPQFDILVNNAGIGRMGTLETTGEAVFDELVAVNLKGPLFVTQHALARLRDGGRIINLSSVLSRIAFPQMMVYSFLKTAINHFTLLAAAELGKRRITVNAIGPGLTVTDFTARVRQDPKIVHDIASSAALGRLGEAEDIARVAAWLASEDAGWVTGQYIEASGGAGLVHA
jgi:NAD(P)-dependent dehydrogenase (short-subunit alcohol dehydrogenase family)